MSRTQSSTGQSRAAVGPVSFWKRLKELDMFFQGKDPVHQTMRRLARRLERMNIPYAVGGGYGRLRPSAPASDE
jgi:hypothetical protein